LVESNSSYQIQVHTMLPPEELVPCHVFDGDNKYWNKNINDLQYFPALGAFEVYVNRILIYSKVHSKKWPNIDLVADKILEMFVKYN